MQRIGTGSRGDHATITFNPLPDATPTDFERQLRGSGVLASYLVGIEHHGPTVTVVLTNIAGAKSALRAAGHLPRFTYLLPEN